MFILGCVGGIVIGTVMSIVGLVLCCGFDLAIRHQSRSHAFADGAVLGGIIGAGVNALLVSGVIRLA